MKSVAVLEKVFRYIFLKLFDIFFASVTVDEAALNVLRQKHYHFFASFSSALPGFFSKFWR